MLSVAGFTSAEDFLKESRNLLLLALALFFRAAFECTANDVLVDEEFLLLTLLHLVKCLFHTGRSSCSKDEFDRETSTFAEQRFRQHFK